MTSIIKDLPQQRNLEQFNILALSTFLDSLSQVSSKALFMVGIDSTNQVRIFFIDGIGARQVKELCQQIVKELEKMDPSTPEATIKLPFN